MTVTESAPPARTRVRSLLDDRVTLALGAVFLLAAAFYLWTAATSVPLTLHGADSETYNRLADAFLHLRLSLGDAPEGLLRLPDPYDPVQNLQFRTAYGVHDLALYDGRLYATWGPAPALVLLVPMHLIGLAPSPSV